MLSRTAERIYWTGRYLERAENTARLTKVFTNLLIDLPKGAPIGWEMLPEITGGRKQFEKRFQVMDERNVMKFLLVDRGFSGSAFNSISAARENARTTREVLPNEAWEMINDLYFFIKENNAAIGARSKRNLLLDGVVQRSQQLSGMLKGTMSRDVAYHFLEIGCALERADMTTRILDTGSIDVLTPDEERDSHFGNIIWLNILDSLGAEQMFRKQHYERIGRESVLNFLLRNRTYPHSVIFCLESVEGELYLLPQNEATQHTVRHAKLHLNKSKNELLTGTTLHHFLDRLQLNFNFIHNELSSTWFGRERAVAKESNDGNSRSN